MTFDVAPAIPAAIAQLLVEHDAARQQLAILEAALAATRAGNAAAMANGLRLAEQTLDYLRGDLERHIAREEGPLFPLLKAALPADDRLIDEMVAEHDLIRIKRDGLRSAIEELLGDHDDVRADLTALRDLLAATPPAAQQTWLTALVTATRVLSGKMAVHFQNEEELVFPLAPQLLDEATLARIMAEMTALGPSQHE